MLDQLQPRKQRLFPQSVAVQVAWTIAQLQCRHLQVLRASQGAMQLLDMSSHLPSLKRLPGMKKWYGRDKLRYYASWAEAMQVSLHIRGQQLLWGSRCFFGAGSAKLLELFSALYLTVARHPAYVEHIGHAGLHGAVPSDSKLPVLAV